VPALRNLGHARRVGLRQLLDTASAARADRVRLSAAVSRSLAVIGGYVEREELSTRPVATPRKDAWSPAPGDWIAGYRLGARIGQGGLGVVFRARDLALDRDVAIKFAHTVDALADHRDRLLAEARVMASIAHPRLVTAHACGWHRGQPFVVMELVEGETALARMHGHGGRLAIAEVLHVVGAVGEAIDWLHAAGLEHGDVKPGNVLLGVGGAVRLIDGGAQAPRGERASDFVGTPAYAAPERLLGEDASAGLSVASDVYSLAAMAFELFTGTLPFHGRGELTETDHGTLGLDVPRASTLRPGLHARVDAALAAGLARDPAARPRSARELVERLRGERVRVTPQHRVLVIDPDPKRASLLARAIVERAPRSIVHQVEDLASAAFAIETHRPDGIVIALPELAEAALRLVCELRPLALDVPMVALTASGDARAWAALRELGVVACYLHPVAVEDVVAALARGWASPPRGEP